VPSYVEYERIANIYGLETKYIYLKEENNFQLDLEELEQSLQEPALVFLARPNNPTGQTIPAQKLASLIQKHPQSVFIIDEAFADFVPALKRMYSYSLPNIITVISLTKFFALPGLRVGLAIARKSLCRQIENFLPPWSVNFLAQEIASAALKDQKYIAKTLKALPEFKENFIPALKTFRELTIFPGQANFILVKLKRQDINAEQLAQKLLSQKILIRDCSNFNGLDSRFFRLAIKTHKQNCQLISALKASLCQG
jgi:histidinol-phosphate/aromatic aminotransferase/cobyric acid decarboxylase-like protein